MEILESEIRLILNDTTKKLISNFEEKIKLKKISLAILIKSSIEILNEFLKAITGLTKNNKDKRDEYLKRIEAKDIEFFKAEYYKRYKKDAKKDDSSNKMKGLVYLINNIEHIDLSTKNRCSAEGHISNVLSKRMSSRPMGWSRKGANIMAGYLVFSRNGGKIENLFKKIDTNNILCDRIKSIGEKEYSIERKREVPAQNSYTILGLEGLQDKISEKLKSVLSQCKSVLPRIL